MSVGDQLGLENDSVLLEEARRRWPTWAEDDARLAVVDGFDALHDWLRSAGPQQADRVLLALAMLAAPDGGNDVAAAAALAKCLMPGACRVAGWLCMLPDLVHRGGAQPPAVGHRFDRERVDELVAAELWIQVRSFPWRRLRKVAANIVANTRAGVLREMGDWYHLRRSDRTWAHTQVSEALVWGDHLSAYAPADATEHRRVPAGLARLGEALAVYDEEEPSAVEQLLEVLAWGCAQEVITAADRQLMLCLVEEAHQMEARYVRRSDCGGLLNTELSRRVAPRVGAAEATVRRRAARSMRALAAAVSEMSADES